MKYPDGEIVTTTYDNNMLPKSVIGASAYAQSITYDSAMRMRTLVRGANILSTVFNYNPWNVDSGRLLNLTSTRVADGTVLQNSTYVYDPVGNIQTITDSVVPSNPQTQTFTYDELDRLLSSNVSGGTNGLYTEAYAYDSATGNLSGKAGLTYTYASGHAHAVSSLSNGNTYAYDANGNMTSRNVNGQSFTLNYDAENRLVSVTGAVTANFYYDGDGKQVKAVVNGVTTFYVGNHYEVKNGVVSKNYFAGATRLAVRKGGTLSFLLADHIGSTSVITDANGATTIDVLYKAFGEMRNTPGGLPTDYKFTGQREQAELGIYFFQSRWFDPSLGRFLSPDSIVPTGSQGTQAWDRYAFVNNNPVRYNDPTGHMIDNGCEGDDSEGCSLTQYQADLDAQKLALLEAEAAERECKAGNEAYCSPLTYAKMVATGERKIGWDASLVPWDEVVMDALGLAGDLTVVAEVPVTYMEGAQLLNASITGVEAYTDAWSIAQGQADPVNVVLNTISVIPGIGAVTSVIGLVYNLSQGFYLY